MHSVRLSFCRHSAAALVYRSSVPLRSLYQSSIPRFTSSTPIPAAIDSKMAPSTSAKTRLDQVASSLSPAREPEFLGTLNLGSISLPIHESLYPERLPLHDQLLEPSDPFTASHLEWMVKKTLLNQDIFLLSVPSPYPRLLALAYCRLVNRSFEYVTLHRDIGESELKQGREIREGGILEYVDSAVVRASKMGSILILDGIQRCERGVLPMLNNLLENREINLEDGNSIISPDRYALMKDAGENLSTFIAAHKDFRIIAIGTPVPPFPGAPLDPPFRSRFQVRYIDPLASARTLAVPHLKQGNAATVELVDNLGKAITALQVMKEMRTKMASGISSPDELPDFPQTAVSKLAQFLAIFPPPHSQSPAQVVNTLLAIHPALSYITQANWRSLETAFTGVGLEKFIAGVAECDSAEVGLSSEGILGWSLRTIERSSERSAKLTFERNGLETIQVEVAAGPRPFASFPLQSTPSLLITPRFIHQLTSLFQLHALKDFDISIIPPSSSLQTSSSSTTLLISTFASLLGYHLETVHLYKELGGRELFTRRVVENGMGGGGSAGTTSWVASPLIQGALRGALVHLEGIDALGATVGTLARLIGERETELWEGKRIVGGERLSAEEIARGVLLQAHPAFRIIATASKSAPPKEYLTEELSSMLLSLPTLAMSIEEERAILLATGCSSEQVELLINFAEKYRRIHSAPGSKSRRLGTAGLVRIAARLALFPEEESIFALMNRCLLSEFLPLLDKELLASMMQEMGIIEGPNYWNPPAEVTATHLVFPAASDPKGLAQSRSFPLFDSTLDPDGVALVPYMETYLDNSQQTALMKDIATDLEAGEYPLLLGAQGVGKNKIVDRLLQLMRRPREYIQLHRDTTTQSLMFQTSLDGGIIRYVDSPLLRAVKLGRVLVIDEVDKCSPPVVAGLASLASRGEMTLSDGRRITRPLSGQETNPGDIIIHPNFRLILLANRPGFPFLGNAFVRVLGDAFSCHPITNPDPDSEERVLSKLAPDLEPALLRSLVGAFGDLRRAFELGTLNYPYSLRELIALVRHLKRFPEDSLEQALRDIFDFDVNRQETIDLLYDILRKNKLKVERVGIDAVRVGGEETKKPPVVIEFTPKDNSLSQPKYGKDDDKPHVGGNTWAGGTGGRDTAGLGGRGGYMRLYKGHDINQISQELKDSVPEEIKTQARDMARAELAKQLAEIDLTNGQASVYSQYYNAVQSHVNQLVTFLDNLEANEEERIWLKRQSDGELDESRLTEGLTGEAGIYKRRGLEKPEAGTVQLKPKRIRFIFDLSASMYRNQYDGRLTRSLEAAVMILEAFSRLTRKEKYRIDLVGQSGEEAVISLVALDNMPTHAGERYKIVAKAAIIPQYTWSGDHTIEAIEAGVAAVADSDSDDYFCIIISDANFERYGITAEHLKHAMELNPKVKCSLIAIGEGAEATWLPNALPGKAHRVTDTSGIATALRTILASALGAGGL